MRIGASLQCDWSKRATEKPDYDLASSCSAPRNSLRSERTTQRDNTTMTASNMHTMAMVAYGCWVANQVRKIASPSSPRLRVIFENGSGEGVTAARTAVLPP